VLALFVKIKLQVKIGKANPNVELVIIIPRVEEIEKSLLEQLSHVIHHGKRVAGKHD
jgi:hypothetical protein